MTPLTSIKHNLSRTEKEHFSRSFKAFVTEQSERFNVCALYAEFHEQRDELEDDYSERRAALNKEYIERRAAIEGYVPVCAEEEEEEEEVKK